MPRINTKLTCVCDFPKKFFPFSQLQTSSISPCFLAYVTAILLIDWSNSELCLF